MNTMNVSISAKKGLFKLKNKKTTSVVLLNLIKISVLSKI